MKAKHKTLKQMDFATIDAWRLRMGFKVAEAVEILGYTRHWWYAHKWDYEAGHRGENCRIPRAIFFACAAIESGIPLDQLGEREATIKRQIKIGRATSPSAR